MKIKVHCLLASLVFLGFAAGLRAQTAPPPRKHVNIAIVPEPQQIADAGPRQKLVLQRAETAQGDYDIEFIGDSITQLWEGPGNNVWRKYYGGRKCLNFGVGGDRTENVLWRFEQGQLEGVKAKIAVVMIGTNNSGRDSEADMLEGVTAVVQQIRTRQPETKILLLGIFPREPTFSGLRGKILQVNQALAKLDDGRHVFYMDIGSRLIEKDGSISKNILSDGVHPAEGGYEIWAEAMEAQLKQLLLSREQYQTGRRTDRAVEAAAADHRPKSED
jgi:lysophospholipase L1-like esterase